MLWDTRFCLEDDFVGPLSAKLWRTAAPSKDGILEALRRFPTVGANLRRKCSRVAE